MKLYTIEEFMKKLGINDLAILADMEATGFLQPENETVKGTKYYSKTQLSNFSYLYSLYVDFKRLERQREETQKKEEIERRLNEKLYGITPALRFSDEPDAEKEELREKLRKEREKATHDALTKCYNRQGYEDQIERLKENRTLIGHTLIALDINNLKITNDSMGHEAGDKLIVTIANKLREYYKCVYRVGGDEFLILSPVEEFDEVDLKRIDRELERLTVLEEASETPIKYEVAYGYTTIEDEDVAKAQRIADELMYKNKAKKKAFKEDDEHPEVSPKEDARIPAEDTQFITPEIITHKDEIPHKEETPHKEEAPNRRNKEHTVIGPPKQKECSHKWIRKGQTQSTCTEKGITRFVCKLCKTERTEEQDLLPHKFTEEFVPPTCTTDGRKRKICSVCGAEEEGSDQFLPMLGHNYEETVLEQPTEEKPGRKKFKCLRCGEYKFEEIPKLERKSISQAISEGLAAAKIEELTAQKQQEERQSKSLSAVSGTRRQIKMDGD